MEVNYWSFLSKIVNKDNTNNQIVKESFSPISYSSINPSRREKLWMPKASYRIDMGTKTLSIALDLDFNENIILASVMTDQFYQSDKGEADSIFYIWTHPEYRKYENITFQDNSQYKNNIDALYHIENLMDLVSIAKCIYSNNNIPNVPMELSLNMATRIVIRQCLKTLQKSENKTHQVSEFNTEHLKWMCEKILQSDFPLDKMNRWLGFIQAGLIIHNLMNVNDERDKTRPIFHLAYKTEGINIP